MTSVTFPTALGGDGSTVSDDADPTTGLRNAGYKTRFVPALQQTVNMTQTAVNKAAAAAASEAVTVAKAAEARASELAAAGYANAAAQVSTGFDTLRPKIRPAFNLDFVNQEFVDRRVVVSRAGPKSYFGKRKVLGDENLVRFSEQFDNNAAWTKSSMTIIANSLLAPDGLTTADTAQHSGASGQTAQSLSSTANTDHTFSIFVKQAVAGFIRVLVGNTGGSYFGGWFNTSTGAWATTDAGGGGTFVSVAVTSLLDGWYRISITGRNNSTNYNPNFYLTAVDNTSTRSITPVVYVWGAQLEQRSALTAYIRTTDYPVRTFFNALETAAANVMPIEYDPVSQQCLGIRPENSAVNLLLRSEEFDNAAWTKFASTVSSNLVVAPNGSLTAELLQEDSATAQHLIAQNVTVSATTYIFSVYAKSFGRKRISLRYGAISPTDSATFDLSSGTVVAGVGSIQSIGNGWYRCSVVSVASGSGTRGHQIYLNSDTGTGAESYAGNGWSGVAIWGAQLEASNLGVPSSYVPTTSAQVTRLVDNITVPVSEFDYNQNEGTVYVESNAPFEGIAYNWQLDDGSLDNRIYSLFRNADQFAVRNGNSVQATLDAGNPILNANNRTVGFYKDNNFGASLNGAAVVTDTSGSVPNSITTLRLGTTTGAGGPLNGYIRCLRYYNVALSAAEAQALSKV